MELTEAHHVDKIGGQEREECESGGKEMPSRPGYFWSNLTWELDNPSPFRMLSNRISPFGRPVL